MKAKRDLLQMMQKQLYPAGKKLAEKRLESCSSFSSLGNSASGHGYMLTDKNGKRKYFKRKRSS